MIYFCSQPEDYKNCRIQLLVVVIYRRLKQKWWWWWCSTQTV